MRHPLSPQPPEDNNEEDEPPVQGLIDDKPEIPAEPPAEPLIDQCPAPEEDEDDDRASNPRRLSWETPALTRRATKS